MLDCDKEYDKWFYEYGEDWNKGHVKKVWDSAWELASPQVGSEAVSAESALLCGNGNNKLFIAVTCKHHVYNEEWVELVDVINRAIGDYKGGDFKNVIAMITPAI